MWRHLNSRGVKLVFVDVVLAPRYDLADPNQVAGRYKPFSDRYTAVTCAAGEILRSGGPRWAFSLKK